MSRSEGQVLELPAALVEEMLAKSKKVGDSISTAINGIRSNKTKIRSWLESEGLIGKDVELSHVDTPTTCGIDGAYVLERLLSVTVVACAAVAVEGITPPSEKRHWPLKYESFMDVGGHDPELNSVARGLMKIKEAKLAAVAPHDVVLLDGSITSNIIHMNQALSSVRKNDSSKIVENALLDEYADFLRWFKIILDSDGVRVWASLPKYTTRSEIGYMYDPNGGWPQKQDDRSAFTTILKPGEYTKPQLITREDDSWHLPTTPIDGIRQLQDMCLESIEKQRVLYYKPFDFTPALRVEVGSWAESDTRRLAILLQSLKYQCASYAIMEPYPLYMADRMVKSLGSTLPIIKQHAMQNVATNTPAENEEILFSIRGYRTEGGR